LGDKALQILPFPYDEAIDTAFVQLRETLILRRPGYQLRAISIFYELVARIEEVSGTSAPESAYPETVRNAIIFLRESYASPFSAAKTAAVVGLSASHLRALFEKWLGESPKRFHTRCRIDQAKRLLREQNLRVAEVAFHVGFRDAAHFSRIFKQVTGIAPNGYARQEQVSQPPRR
jgi:two-component system response regulator YesN